MYALFKIDEEKVTDIYGPFDSEELAGKFRDEFFDDSQKTYVTELLCPYSIYRGTFK